jgi:acetyl-CoA carboxylase biotin carboxyl carrier protein
MAHQRAARTLRPLTRHQTRMDFDELNKILDIVRAHELSEFELEREGFKIKIKKGSLVHPAMPGIALPVPQLGHNPGAAPSPSAPSAPEAVPAADALSPEEMNLAIVKSPIVGTFFRASEPGAPSFVDVGDVVKKGQVLCIIEAMKLMNEIDSEYEGEIVKVYVDNGQPVQYGERLFAIKAPGDV